jgi:choline dehydrogenase-like flavoprotein
MLSDFRTVGDDESFDADLCIIGAGAAGIAMAISLIGSNHRVCVLESGGLSFEPDTQDLYAGEEVGVRWGTTLDTSRIRGFGGTTAIWGGGCVPLDDMDFRERPWVPHSGWPISRSDLDPWYERARPIFHIEDRPLVPDGTAAEAALSFHFDPSKIVHKNGPESPQPRLGEVFRADLERAANIRVLLHANLVELATNQSASVVSEARIRTLEGKAGRIRARYFVLACGGIENARLLLLSNATAPNGLGNGNDLVGRFFMDHPGGRLGLIMSDAPNRLADPYNRQMKAPGVPRPGEPCLSRMVQEKERLLNARLRPQDYENAQTIPDGVLAVRQFEAGLHGGNFPGGLASVVWRMATDLGDVVPGVYRRFRGLPVVADHRIVLEGYFEQAPNPDSRIELVESVDALGQRRARLDWRLTELDLRTYRVASEIFAAELARLGLGRVQLDPWSLPDATTPPPLEGVHHHLGTTRMSNDPRTGVVDADCKVHGIENLYIAGGSVFPTGGWALPTLTIVALALRLSDHLDARLK